MSIHLETLEYFWLVYFVHGKQSKFNENEKTIYLRSEPNNFSSHDVSNIGDFPVKPI